MTSQLARLRSLTIHTCTDRPSRIYRASGPNYFVGSGMFEAGSLSVPLTITYVGEPCLESIPKINNTPKDTQPHVISKRLFERTSSSKDTAVSHEVKHYLSGGVRRTEGLAYIRTSYLNTYVPTSYTHGPSTASLR